MNTSNVELVRVIQNNQYGLYLQTVIAINKSTKPGKHMTKPRTVVTNAEDKPAAINLGSPVPATVIS